MADQEAAAEAAEAEAVEGEEPEIEGEEGEEPEWVAPTRAEYEATLAKAAAKLKRANDQAQKLREATKAKPAATAEGEGAGAVTSADVEKWQTVAIRSAAEAKLLARHADPETVDLLLARLKPGEIELDSSDRPELDDWLEEMEERYPKMFTPPAAAPAQPRHPGRVDQGASGQPVRPQMSLGEKIVAKSEAARRAGGGRARIGG